MKDINQRINSIVRGKYHKSIFMKYIDKNTNISTDEIDYILSGYEKYIEHYDYFRKENSLFKNFLFEDFFKKSEITLSDFERFNDYVEKNILERKVNALVNRNISKKHREFLDEESYSAIETLVLNKITNDIFKTFFTKKISSIKSKNDFKFYLNNFIDSYVSWNKDFIYEKIKENKLKDGIDYIIHKEKNKEKYFIEIKTFNASKVLGSNLWCSSRDVSMFKKYKYLSDFVFILDFTKKIYDKNSHIAVLLNPDNIIKEVYLKNDELKKDIENIQIDVNNIVCKEITNINTLIRKMILKMDQDNFDEEAEKEYEYLFRNRTGREIKNQHIISLIFYFYKNPLEKIDFELLKYFDIETKDYSKKLSFSDIMSFHNETETLSDLLYNQKDISDKTFKTLLDEKIFFNTLKLFKKIERPTLYAEKYLYETLRYIDLNNDEERIYKKISRSIMLLRDKEIIFKILNYFKYKKNFIHFIYNLFLKEESQSKYFSELVERLEIKKINLYSIFEKNDFLLEVGQIYDQKKYTDFIFKNTIIKESEDLDVLLLIVLKNILPNNIYKIRYTDKKKTQKELPFSIFSSEDIKNHILLFGNSGNGKSFFSTAFENDFNAQLIDTLKNMILVFGEEKVKKSFKNIYDFYNLDFKELMKQHFLRTVFVDFDIDLNNFLNSYKFLIKLFFEEEYKNKFERTFNIINEIDNQETFHVDEKELNYFMKVEYNKKRKAYYIKNKNIIIKNLLD